MTGDVSPRPPEWFAALLWLLVGAGLGLAISVLGLLTVPLALVGGTLLLTLGRRWAASTAVLAVSGLGLVPLYVAWLNRDGPGTVCRSSADGAQSCTEEWSPWPWAAAGLGLVVLGVVLLAVVRARRTGSTVEG